MPQTRLTDNDPVPLRSCVELEPTNETGDHERTQARHNIGYRFEIWKDISDQKISISNDVCERLKRFRSHSRFSQQVEDARTLFFISAVYVLGEQKLKRDFRLICFYENAISMINTEKGE